MLHCQSLKEIRLLTPAENRVGNSSVRKGFDQLESSFASHTHEWFWSTWSKMTSMFVNRYLRYISLQRPCLWGLAETICFYVVKSVITLRNMGKLFLSLQYTIGYHSNLYFSFREVKNIEAKGPDWCQLKEVMMMVYILVTKNGEPVIRKKREGRKDQKKKPRVRNDHVSTV